MTDQTASDLSYADTLWKAAEAQVAHKPRWIAPPNTGVSRGGFAGIVLDNGNV